MAQDWIGSLLASPIYASQRQLAARVALHDDKMRTLLEALTERGGKLSRSALANRLGFGRGHYRDLLAFFSGTQLLTGRCGSAEVGYIDPSMLTGDEPRRLLLLAGRSWLVKEIEWNKKVVWLEPAKEEGKARWMGSARSLTREVCQGIRAVILAGDIAGAHLSLRAKSELQSVTDDLALSPDADFMSRAEGAQVRTWTFAGTKQNRTYARNTSIAGSRVRFDALSVQAPADALFSRADDTSAVQLTAQELTADAKGIKFANLIPSVLLHMTVVARHFSM